MRSLVSLLSLGAWLGMCSLAGSAAGEEEAKVKVNFSGLDLAALLRQAERVTAKSFLCDEAAVRGRRVTLQSETAVNKQEFYQVVQAVCQMHGLVLLPVENAGLELVKVVPAQSAFKEPGARQVLSRGDPLPENEVLVSYLVKLKHVQPARVIQVLTPLLSSMGSVQPVANTDLLLVNDVSSTLRRVEKVVAMLDQAGPPAKQAAVTLANVPVERAQALLGEYLQALSKGQAGEVERERLSVVRDERLSALYLVGPAAEVEKAQLFLAKIDVELPSARRTVRYYKLKNVAVKQAVDYTAQLLGIALTVRASEPGQASPGTGAAGERSAAPVAPTVTSGTGGRRLVGVKGGPGGVAAAELVPVEGLNTLVVAGDEAVHKEVECILRNLDQRKCQVLIEVAIIQVTGDDSLDVGTEFLALSNAGRQEKYKMDAGTGFGLGTQSDSPGRGFPTRTVLSGIAGAAAKYVKENQFQVLLQALATRANVSIVSQPLLLVNDNEDAQFTTKVSEPTTTTSQGTATTNTSFAGFAEAVTALKITPHVSPDGYINLEIVQTFEEFTGASTAAGIPPPKVSNSATTKVTIPDRQVIVIGGFTRDVVTETLSGVPGLMKIPGLGRAFSRETKKKSNSRLYLFVCPKVLEHAGFEDLKSESQGKRADVDKLTRQSPIHKEINARLRGGAAEPDGKASKQAPANE